jgi:threonine/homoserine/homoserine lactone efflux protein
MSVLLRILAVLCVLIGAFLIFAVINAAASDGGARAGVAIGYIVGAAILAWAAVSMWRAANRRGASTPVAP